ncbi:hypothetical protein EG328_006800 [Venturia inaequalis]|uniref:Dienelactone hydrolase n=1 Tax=Venturia inaequalis TaxID=5025 RepID=A0A8H3UFA2_VENIN|nr:hypothetical protein EG328_006800 [Venturia inaequalis]
MALTAYNNSSPKLYITAETDDAAQFDQKTLKYWHEEGFDIEYVPFGNGGVEYVNVLKSLRVGLGMGEAFGIVAFGDAATACLETFHKPPLKLAVMVAYYPTAIPDPKTPFPPGCNVLVHFAGASPSVGVTTTPVMLGLQGKRKIVKRRLPEGFGAGGIGELAYPSYVYEDAEPGFAEHDVQEYDKVASRLSWSRSLSTVRKAFGIEIDLERVWEEHVELEFATKDADRTMETMVRNPCADRVVDEMLLSFEHTQEMPWMLPGVPPTNKPVEVALVSVVCIRGEKLYHEHIYWDQASVLVQIGLLDPSLIPEAFKGKVKRLPVAGKESARKVMDEDSEPSNELIAEW